jgi:hypothetical protein
MKKSPYLEEQIAVSRGQRVNSRGDPKLEGDSRTWKRLKKVGVLNR